MKRQLSSPQKEKTVIKTKHQQHQINRSSLIMSLIFKKSKSMNMTCIDRLFNYSHFGWGSFVLSSFPLSLYFNRNLTVIPQITWIEMIVNAFFECDGIFSNCDRLPFLTMHRYSTPNIHVFLFNICWRLDLVDFIHIGMVISIKQNRKTLYFRLYDHIFHSKYD